MPAVRDTLHFIQKNWVPIRTASLEILMRDECVLHGDVHYKNVGFRQITSSGTGNTKQKHISSLKKKQSSNSSISSSSSVSSSHIFAESNVNADTHPDVDDKDDDENDIHKPCTPDVAENEGEEGFQACFVDFQSAGPGSIAAELLYFLCTSCPVDIAEEEYWNGEGFGVDPTSGTSTSQSPPSPGFNHSSDNQQQSIHSSLTNASESRLPALHVSLAGLSIVVPQQQHGDAAATPPPPSSPSGAASNTNPRRNSSEEHDNNTKNISNANTDWAGAVSAYQSGNDAASPSPRSELDEAAFYGAPATEEEVSATAAIANSTSLVNKSATTTSAAGLGDSFTPSRKLLLLEPPNSTTTTTTPQRPAPHHNGSNSLSSTSASPLAATTGGASVTRVPSNTRSFPASLRESFAGLAATISGGGGGASGGAWRTRSNAPSPHGVSRLDSYKDPKHHTSNLRSSLVGDEVPGSVKSMPVDALVVRHLVARKQPQHHHHHHRHNGTNGSSSHGSSSNPHRSKTQATSALDHPPWFKSASSTTQNNSSATDYNYNNSTPRKSTSALHTTEGSSNAQNEPILTSSGAFQGGEAVVSGGGSRASSASLLSPLAAGGLHEYHVLPTDLLPTVFQNIKTSEPTDDHHHTKQKNENMLIVKATPLHDSAKEYKLQRSRLRKIALNTTLLPPAFDYMSNTYFHSLRYCGGAASDAVENKRNVMGSGSGDVLVRNTTSSKESNAKGSHHSSTAPDNHHSHIHQQKVMAVAGVLPPPPPSMTTQISCATRAASEERITLEAAINRYEGLERLERRRLRKTAKMVNGRKGSKGQLGRQASSIAATAAGAVAAGGGGGGGGGLLGSFGTSIQWGQVRSVTSSPALSFAQPTTPDTAGPTTHQPSSPGGGGSHVMAVEPFTLGDQPIIISNKPPGKSASNHHHHRHHCHRRQDTVNGDFGASRSTTHDRTPGSNGSSSPATSSTSDASEEEQVHTRTRPTPQSLSAGGVVGGGGEPVGSLSLLSDIMRVGGGGGGGDHLKVVGFSTSSQPPEAAATSTTPTTAPTSTLPVAMSTAAATNPSPTHRHHNHGLMEEEDCTTTTTTIALHSVLALSTLQDSLARTNTGVVVGSSTTTITTATTPPPTVSEQSPNHLPPPAPPQTPHVPIVRQDTLQGDDGCFDAYHVDEDDSRTIPSSTSHVHHSKPTSAPPPTASPSHPPPPPPPQHPRRFMNLQELFHYDSCIIDEYYDALPDHVKVVDGASGARAQGGSAVAAVVRDAGLFGPTPPNVQQQQQTSSSTSSSSPRAIPSSPKTATTTTCRPITKERLLYEVYLLARHWAGCLLFDLRGGSPQERDRFRSMHQFKELISWGERTARRVILTAASVYCVLDSHFEIMDRNAIAVAEIGNAINTLRERV